MSSLLSKSLRPLGESTIVDEETLHKWAKLTKFGLEVASEFCLKLNFKIPTQEKQSKHFDESNVSSWEGRKIPTLDIPTLKQTCKLLLR